MRQDKKIWVADDDESIRWVLEKGLSEAGFEVSTFEDGNEVVNQLDIESPNIVLTDMRSLVEMEWIFLILLKMIIQIYPS